MKTIKWLWSIALALFIVLLYATVTSFFVNPNTEWYLMLDKGYGKLVHFAISEGCALTYAVDIIILTALIYSRRNYSGVMVVIGIGILQTLWAGVVYLGHSLLGGVIIAIMIVALSLLAFDRISDNKMWQSIVFTLAVMWYCYMAIVCYNLWLWNYCN